MAATTASNNRIPLHVNHGSPSANQNYSTTYEYRTTTGGNGQPQQSSSAYDMGPMSDETDRIKQRMREFEDRCKKWREDFFINKTEVQSDFDQRVPPPFTTTSVDPNNNNNQFTYSSNISHRSPSRQGAPPVITTSSSMHHQHRTTLEDTPGGGKKYKIEFEIGDFKQNELQISTHGNSTLVVKGDREVKAGLATETKTFNREITLPDYVDVASMNAYLLDSHTDSLNNVLIVEAPVIMDKYTYRRSAFDHSQSPVRVATAAAPPTASRTSPAKTYSATPVLQPQSILRNTTNDALTTAHHHHHHHHHSSSENKSSTTTTTKIVRDVSPVSGGGGSPVVGFNDLNNTQLNLRQSRTNLTSQSLAPELIRGYPTYDSAESCVVYKFDLAGFDQTEIQLTITVDRTLEIKASKEVQDNLGEEKLLLLC
jgi:HSP20 family molecular chaperone IbpA